MNPIDRANKAKSLLENPLFDESFSEVRNKLIEGMEKCPISDVQTAEDFRRCLKLLSAVKTNLVTAINSGKIESFRLAQEEARRKNPLRNIYR